MPPPHETVTLSGVVRDVFAHRFTVATADGMVLADLGPKGAELFALKTGDAVRFTGSRKPSEIKVHAIARTGEAEVVIDRDGKAAPHAHVDPSVALRAADRAGYAALGEPRRKPKHFELRARDARGQEVELHIELDGRIRKEKPIARA